MDAEDRARVARQTVEDTLQNLNPAPIPSAPRPRRAPDPSVANWRRRRREAFRREDAMTARPRPSATPRRPSTPPANASATVRRSSSGRHLMGWEADAADALLTKRAAAVSMDAADAALVDADADYRAAEAGRASPSPTSARRCSLRRTASTAVPRRRRASELV